MITLKKKSPIFILFILFYLPLSLCSMEENNSKELFSGRLIPFELEREIMKQCGIKSYFSLSLLNHATYQKSQDPSLWPSFIEEVFEIPLSQQENLKFPEKYQGKNQKETFLLMIEDLKSLYFFILGSSPSPLKTHELPQEFHFFFLPSFKWIAPLERQKILCLNFQNSHPIRWIPPSLGLLTHLNYLDLSFTLIQSLPPCLWHLPNLQHLYLDHTPLKEAGYPEGRCENVHLPSLLAFGINSLLLKDLLFFHHKLPGLTHLYVPELETFSDSFKNLKKTLHEREKEIYVSSFREV